MHDLFYPKSVCVFGVSTKPNNFGKNIVKNLLDFEFQGPVYAVGQEEGEIYGVRIYKSILDIEETVELAVFLTPARAVPPLLEECGKKGIKRAVISSGGFSELEDDRADLEKQVLDIAARYQMRFLGPNCIGIINQDVGLCLPFPRLKRFPSGPVALLAQSGGVSLSMIMLFVGENMGINKMVSLGNKLNVGEDDLLPMLEDDESTKIIAMYLEEVNQGRRLVQAMRNVSKPVIVYKSNVTEQGARIAKSHTAAIAGDDRVVDAALRQVGAIRVHDMNEMVSVAKAFQLPPLQGNRVAIISPTGGFAVIMADECEKAGFVLPPFPESFINDIRKHVRAGVIKLTNPLDLGDMFDMEMVANTVMRALQEPGIDALILGWIYFRDVGLGMTAVTAFPLLRKLMKVAAKPVALCIVGAPSETAELKKQAGDVPIFNSPEETVRALSALHRHSIDIYNRTEPYARAGLDGPAIRDFLSKVPGDALIGKPAMDFLKLAGYSVAPYALATTADEAAASAQSFGFPVVLKIESPDILHKTEVGGVRLGLRNADEVKAAFNEMVASVRAKSPESNIHGVLVQPMLSGGRECIVGANINPQFGHIVVFGLGGILVEALEDIAIRVAPITRTDAEHMLGEIRAKKILGAFRGMGPADREAVLDAVIRTSTLVTDFPEIAELDINPLLVFEQGRGVAAVDARILLKR